MAQIHVIGHITTDLELKRSQRGNTYVRFDVVENISKGDHRRPQYYQVWAWNDQAKALAAAKLCKGLLVEILGSLELAVYTKQDGRSTDKRLKIMLKA